MNAIRNYLRTWGIDIQAWWSIKIFELRLLRALWRFRNGK